MGKTRFPSSLEPDPGEIYSSPMLRFLALALLCLVGPEITRAYDIVLISGGPALRSHERFKVNTHDLSLIHI